MDTDGARRLNRSSPSCLNSGAQRTDFFHGLLRAHATRLLALLDDYGPQELAAAAVAVALERDALGAGSITHILETRRRQRGHKPPLRLTLPNRPGLQDIDVRPHDLETYDALSQHHPDDAGD